MLLAVAADDPPHHVGRFHVTASEVVRAGLQALIEREGQGDLDDDEILRRVMESELRYYTPPDWETSQPGDLVIPLLPDATDD